MTSLYHVTKDPVHGTMQFTDHENAWIKPFIDSENFQRLRYIKQLGMGDMIFPGAVHTRFNHCWGACYIASQISQKISLKDEIKQLVMIAALLHDIGHGPLSHTFEDLFQDRLIRHEDWTPFFLEDYTTKEFFQGYNALNPDYPLDNKNFSRVRAMIMHESNEMIADIVSSQLDADRLDYLLRDSHFCGVRYGTFDFSWMLHCLLVIETANGKRLGITEKGIGVVEHYLMARRLMLRNIYHLPKKLAYEALLVHFLVEMSQEKNHDSNLKEMPLMRFLSALQQFNKSPQRKKIKAQFLQDHYKDYRLLTDDDVLSLIRRIAHQPAHALNELARRIAHRQMPEYFRLQHSSQKDAEEALIRFKSSHPEIDNWQMGFIKAPQRSYICDEPIYVKGPRGDVKVLNELSLMVKDLAKLKEAFCFIYVDAPLMEKKEVRSFIEKL